MLLAKMAVLLLAAAAAAPSAYGRAEVDPVGVWLCLLQEQAGDSGWSRQHRFYLRLTPDGRTWAARGSEARQGRWVSFGEWRRFRDSVRFADPARRRTFTTHSGLSSLGGQWLDPAGDGGWWWCAAVPSSPTESGPAEPPPVRRLMGGLVPAIMASPVYPRQAIRQAKEGRAVSCYFVNGSGEIIDPDLIELTDEVFREPILAAVARSRYRERSLDHDVLLPACRTFTFELKTAEQSGVPR